MKIVFAIAALAMTGLTAASVNAQTMPTATVAYGDLNLNSNAGRAKLANRVNRAATGVCGDATSLDLAARNHARRCVASVSNDAMKQIESKTAITYASN